MTYRTIDTEWKDTMAEHEPLKNPDMSDRNVMSIQHPNGNHYEGGFSNGKLYGKGRFTWSDGAIYVGDFDLLNKGVCEGTFTFNGRSYPAVLDGGSLSVESDDPPLGSVRCLQ